MNAVRALVQKFKQQSLLAMAIELAVVALIVVPMAGTTLLYMRLFWCVPLTVAVGMFFAHRRWPRVRLRHYLSSRKAVLPAVCAVGGWGLQCVLFGIGIGPASTTAGSMLVGGLVAAAALGTCIAIFEGRIMKDIFELVPVEQRAAFESKLDEIDTAGKGAEGQAADFSELDQGTVVGAIEGQVIGQDATVEAVTQTAFRRARLSATRPHKPVATLLFVGATGSGKTELAKALANALFAGRMIRIDCNELSTEAGTTRLVGAPPGYLGSAEGSVFCRDVGRLGTGVILLDEIEKAHPAVLKVLMGLLDEARITEQSTSRTYNARGFLIVLTSNAAQAEIGKVAASETDPTTRDVKVKDALRDAGFLPEVLARIDAVFPFAPLPARALAQIIEKFLLGFAHDAGVELVSCDGDLLLDLVTKANKTRDYGVREVVRSVENAVVDGLLAVKDQGYRRAAIKVIDGNVDVQPVAGGAA